MKTPKLEVIDQDHKNCLLSIDEFNESVDLGELIDYDGHGYLATATHKSDIVIHPSDWGKNPEENKVTCKNFGFTHILWLNR